MGWIVGVLIFLVAVLGYCLWQLHLKLNKACFVERRGDVLLLKDGKGKIIEENIIIKIK